MKKVSSFLILSMALSLSALPQTSFYDFKVKTIDGGEFDFSTLKGKKVMIVNTASNCGFTPQYKDLEALYTMYSDQLVILGFPANNFAGQEPGSNEEIKKFCSEKYGVTFPMMSKVSVRGKDIDPLYKWLTSKELNGFKDSQVTWNFQKYLINEDGKLVDILPPKDKPDSEKVISWLSE